jgi:hypothetical protein
MNSEEGDAQEHIKGLKKKATISCIKICFLVLLLLILMTNFNKTIPKSTAEIFYYYPSNKNVISIDVVKNNASNNSNGGNNSTSANGGNAKCNVSVPVNTNSSELKVNVLPPKIVMNYAGIEYQGDLSEAKYRAGINFPELHIRPQNITANLPSNIVHVQKGSCIQFLIKGTPKLLPPSSLAVTAYSAISGAASKVLNATNYDNSIFRMNLTRGNYILLATATWLPGSEDVIGYVIYKFVVSVV